MEPLSFHPGDCVIVYGSSPDGKFGACFEDDGTTGYFYALDESKNDHHILDAVHIYDAANVIDREKLSLASIAWSSDGMKCALVINSRPHAAFDFAMQRGFCRSNFPNSPKTQSDGWNSADHSWSDEAVAWLDSSGQA